MFFTSSTERGELGELSLILFKRAFNIDHTPYLHKIKYLKLANFSKKNSLENFVD